MRVCGGGGPVCVSVEECACLWRRMSVRVCGGRGPVCESVEEGGLCVCVCGGLGGVCVCVCVCLRVRLRAVGAAVSSWSAS